MSDRNDRLARNEALFRSVNERVEEVVQPGRDEEIDFLCECGDSDCVEKVTLTRTEYENVRTDARQFAVLPGHDIPEIELVVRRMDRFLVVQKLPEEAQIAEQTDPRT
jgi:hypothetical protein